jgi:hypothetical protein
MQTEILTAIENSIRENRIVAIEVGSPILDVLQMIGDETSYETDYDRENDGSYDVWGFTDATEPSKQGWRLNIRCPA